MSLFSVIGKYTNEQIFEAIKKLRQGIPMSDDMLEYCRNDAEKAIQVALSQGARWVEAEPNIINHAMSSTTEWTFLRNLIAYCQNLVKGRWTELEDAFKSSPHIISGHPFIREYCNTVLKSRWYAIEKHINSPRYIKDYAYHVIDARWPEREEEILKNLDVAYEYCLYVIQERWKEFEDAVIETDFRNKESIIVNYASRFGRWIEAEPHIKSPEYIIRYSTDVIGGRWKDKEPLLVKSPGHALFYAQEVIKGPFPEAEKSLLESSWYFDYFTFATRSSRMLATQLASQFPQDMTIGEVLKLIDDGRNPEFEKKLLSSKYNQGKAVWYAVNVLKNRWPEMEEKIKKSAKWAVSYARDVIKGRWLEAEKYISKNDRYTSQYGVEVIKGKLPDVLHNRMLAAALKNSKNKDVKRYFDMLEQSEI